MNTTRLAVGLGFAMLCCGVSAPAQGASSRSRPPLLRSVVRYTVPGSDSVEIYHHLQFVRADSIDVVRRVPEYAAIQRLEAEYGTEVHAVYARERKPERYRLLQPLGAPVAWTYIAELRGAPAPRYLSPQAACFWLGGLWVLPEHWPLASDQVESTVTFLWPRGWAGFVPWPTPEGYARMDPAQGAEFVATGNWRATEQEVTTATGQCDLVVCVTGEWPVPDAAWVEFAGEMAKTMRDRRRALICVAPHPTAHVWRAVSSCLVLVPTDSASVARVLSRDVDVVWLEN